MATIKNGFISSTINGIAINKSVPCNSGNYSNKSSRDIKYIVIHYTGNKKDDALSNCKYFQTSGRGASSHFFVDDKNIYQSVELRDSAWHCGCSSGYKTACRNSNSIGIEMCTSGNYLVSETTQINSAYLCANLCKLIGINASGVEAYILRHFDVVKTNKKCPVQFVSDGNQWARFKKWVKNILNTGNHLGMSESNINIDNATPSLKVGSSIKSIQIWLNTYYNAGLKTDGSYGANTKKALIKAWQKEAGGLTIDGSFGNASKAKASSYNIKKGSSGIMVTIWQAILVCQGYNPNGIDGSFGNGCKTATVKFQNSNILTANGVVSANTWYKALH